MDEFIKLPGKGNCYFLIWPVAAILLMILMKDRRIRFVLPALLIGTVIENPLFYDLWTNKLHFDYFWRVLWIVPIIPVCAALPATISEKVRNSNLKGLVALAGAGIFILTGTFAYTTPNNTFKPAENVYKVPQSTVEMANKLLELDPAPKAIIHRGISDYIRTYDGRIETLFGRDAIGFWAPPTEDGMKAYNAINSAEPKALIAVAEIMREKDFPYLILDDQPDYRAEQFKEAGLECIYNYGIWGMYVLK